MTRNEDTQPYGFCQCGCGELTRLADRTDSKRGYVRGEPLRYLLNHSKRVPIPPYTGDGLCGCECGNPAPIATGTDRKRGIYKGHPLRFIQGHAARTANAKATASATHRGKTISDAHKRRLSECNTGDRNAQWTGGTSAHAAGYVYRHVGRGHEMANSKGYALEHRIVMAEHIGRMLESDEVVHHKTEAEGGSGRKDDNRIENLLLLPSHAAHVAHHTALRRARLASS